MRWMVILATTQLAACELLFSRPTTTATATDAPPPPDDACVPGPFGSPVRLAEIAVDATHPVLRNDLLELLFVPAGTAASREIHRAIRATPDAPFDNSAPLAEANSSAEDFDPTLTSDGLTLLFVSDRQGPRRAFEMERPSATSPFAGLRRAVGLNAIDVASLTISRDGLTIYFENGAELQAAQRGTLADAFGSPFIIGPLAPSPSISGDELELYYNAPQGIMHATRAARGDMFGPGVLLIPGGAAPAVTADDRAIVFVTVEGVFEQRRACASSGT